MKTWLFSFFVLVTLSTTAQSDSSDYRNTIKLNFAPQLIFDYRNANLGYERLLGDNRSFQINVGRHSLLDGISAGIDSLNITSGGSASGYIIGFEYRFYWMSRNVNPKPDGLYWAPFFYFTHQSLNKEFELIENQIITSSGSFSGDIYVSVLGGALGYQFVIGDKKRWVIDLTTLGVGYGSYSYSLEYKTDLEIHADNILQASIREQIIESIPVLEGLFDDKSVNLNGRGSTFNVGVHLLIQAGFRF